MRAICASLGLDAANLRSEADMRPDLAEKREAEMRRRAWASRAAVLSLTLAAFAGPLAASYRDVIEMRALLGLVVMPIFLAAPPACILHLVYLASGGRRLLSKVAGFPTAGRWLHARRVPLRTVMGIAAFAALLPCLGLAVLDLVPSPGLWTGINVVGLSLGAACGCGTILGVVAEDDTSEGRGPDAGDRVPAAGLAAAA